MQPVAYAQQCSGLTISENMGRAWCLLTFDFDLDCVENLKVVVPRRQQHSKNPPPKSNLEADQRCYQFDISSASDLFTADSLQCVSTQPATVVTQNLRHADETHAYLLTCLALTLSYVHADPDGLPSFADKCSFGNWSSDTYH